MPGSSSRYRFVGKTPWPVRAVIGAAIANLVIGNESRWWASTATAPDAVHSYARHHHGHVLYYTPLAGRYLDGGFLLVHLACIGALALLFHAYRDRLRYVPPPPSVPYTSAGWFLAALVVSPVLLSLVGGFVAGIFWREGAPRSWILLAALPFPLLSLLGVRGALKTLPDPRYPPLPRWLCWGLGVALSVGTIVAVALWIHTGRV